MWYRDTTFHTHLAYCRDAVSMAHYQSIFKLALNLASLSLKSGKRCIMYLQTHRNIYEM